MCVQVKLGQVHVDKAMHWCDKALELAPGHDARIKQEKEAIAAAKVCAVGPGGG